MPDILESLDDYTPEALAEVAKDLQKTGKVRIDGAALLKEAQIQEEEREELNFSSEIEIDDRFDNAESKLNLAENLVIDKSTPEHFRLPVKGVRAQNRKKLFESYNTILEREAQE